MVSPQHLITTITNCIVEDSQDNGKKIKENVVSVEIPGIHLQ